jgi:hypothetical protein
MINGKGSLRMTPGALDAAVAAAILHSPRILVSGSVGNH